MTVIGDSVALGAKSILETEIDNCSVDAEISRNLTQGLALMKELNRKNKLGDCVVMALGVNSIHEHERYIIRIIDALPTGSRLIFVTPFDGRDGGKSDISRTTDFIRTLEEQYDYVTIADWAGAIQDHVEWLTGDKVHIIFRDQALALYMDTITNAMDEAVSKPVKPAPDETEVREPLSPTPSPTLSRTSAPGIILPSDVIESTRSNTEVITNSNPLNIYSDASDKSKYVNQVPKGAVVECFETTKSPEWFYIVYGNIRGYGRSKWLDR